MRHAAGDDAERASSPRVAARHQATCGEIVEAAWRLARVHGLGGISLRDLGAQVGLRAQSLYSYFPSKQAIYDAMFRQGYEQFIAEAAIDTPPGNGKGNGDVRAEALAGVLSFFDFCTADQARYQLLFQRVVPDFEPSPASMAVAVDAYARTVGRLAVVVAADQADLDLWTAVVTGLVDQQWSNDPGGTRWRDLVARAVDMLLDEQQRRRPR